MPRRLQCLVTDVFVDNPILNLSTEEKRVFSFLFNQADTDKIGVVTGERAVSFFERTKVSPNVLGEVGAESPGFWNGC